MKKNPFVIFFFLTLASLSAASLQNQDAPRLSISLMENPQAEAGLETLCLTAADSIELSMRLFNRYEIDRLDFLAPEADLERAALYFKRNGYDNAVFGEIRRNDDGRYIFIIKGWERESESVIVEVERSADSIFDVFDIIDECVIEFLEKFSGEHIGFGRVKFINNGFDSDYNIYVDGNFLGSELSSSEVLFGERTFRITRPGILGDTVIETVTVDITENADHDVVFKIPEPEEDEEPIAVDSAGDGQLILQEGNLFVESTPPGADVFLNGELLGPTPLSLYGVLEGEYKLGLEYRYYFDESEALVIEPDKDNSFSFDMQVSPNHPKILEGLDDPLNAVLLDAGITAAQAAWILFRAFGSGQGFEGLNYFDMMIAGPRYGLLLGGDYIMGPITSVLSMWSFIQFSGVMRPLLGADYHDGGPLYSSIIGLTMIGSILYDLIGTNFAVNKKNEAFLKDVAANGLPEDPADEKDAESDDFFRVAVGTGGGAILSGGAGIRLLSDWLAFEEIAAVSLDEDSPAGFALSASTRVMLYLWPAKLEFMQPYLGGSFTAGTDFSSFGFAAGVFSGVEFELPVLSLYFEGGWTLLNQTGTSPATLAAGVRI